MGQKRNSLQLMIRLHNRGDGPAHLYTADRQDKGMGVSFYFGTSERISRGSMFIQGEHIDDGLNEAKGMLLPCSETTITKVFSSSRCFLSKAKTSPTCPSK